MIPIYCHDCRCNRYGYYDDGVLTCDSCEGVSVSEIEAEEEN